MDEGDIRMLVVDVIGYPNGGLPDRVRCVLGISHFHKACFIYTEVYFLARLKAVQKTLLYIKANLS